MGLAEKRQILMDAIDEYFDEEEKIFYISLKWASESALSSWNEVMHAETKKEIEELKEKINKMNENKSTGAVLFDIAISVVFGPLLGSLAGVGLKGLYSRFTQARKETFSIYKSFDKATARAKTWEEIDFDKLPKEFLERFSKGTLGPRPDWSLSQISASVDSSDYFKYCTGFLESSFSLIGQRSISLLNGSKPPPYPVKKKEDEGVNRIYGDPIKITSLMGTNTQKITPLKTNIESYLKESAKLSQTFKPFLKLLARILKDEKVMDAMSEKLNERKEWILKNEEDISKEFKLVFEAVVWVYYLGSPSKWATERLTEDFPGAHYHNWGRQKPGPYPRGAAKRYRPYQSSAPSKAIVNKYHNYEGRPPWRLPELPHVSVMDVDIPMFLMNYLLDEFVAPGSTKSFFAKSKEKELAGLNRSVPRPPMIGATTTDWYSEDNSARQHAIRDLIVWFTAFDKQLTIGENALKELLSNKVARRVY